MTADKSTKNKQLSYFSFLSPIRNSTNIFDLQFYLSEGNHHTIIIVTDNDAVHT